MEPQQASGQKGLVLLACILAGVLAVAVGSLVLMIVVSNKHQQHPVAQPAAPLPSNLTLLNIGEVVSRIDGSSKPVKPSINVSGADSLTANIKPVQSRAWAGYEYEVSVIVESFRTRADAVAFDQNHTQTDMDNDESIAHIDPPVPAATAFTCGCGGDTIVSFLRGRTRIFIEVETPMTNRVAVADRLARDIDHTLTSGTRAQSVAG